MHSQALTTLFFALNNSLCPDFRSLSCLLLAAQPHPQLCGFKSLLCEQSFLPTHRALAALGLTTARLAEGAYDVSIVLVQRNARATLADLARAIELTRPSGEIYIIGENELGARRFQEPLEKLLGQVEVITKNHCRIMSARREEILDRELYAELRQLSDPFLIEGTCVWSSHYGFSANAIDAGSQLLDQHLPSDLFGRGADLGASSGYLSSSALKHAAPDTHLTLFEAQWRLLELADRTLGAFPSSAFELSWCDVCTDFEDKSRDNHFDFVISNPPFHIGSKTDPRIAERFIEVAQRILRPQGRLFLVANRAFAYEQALKRFTSWQPIVKQRGYAICECIK